MDSGLSNTLSTISAPKILFGGTYTAVAGNTQTVITINNLDVVATDLVLVTKTSAAAAALSGFWATAFAGYITFNFTSATLYGTEVFDYIVLRG